jgi:hypothetical protein
MATIPKVVGLMSCGVLLCLGLSNAAQARIAASVTDQMTAGQSDQGDKMRDPMKGARSKGGWTIRGEVLRIEGNNYVVKGGNGKEVRLHADKTTKIMEKIRPGDRIEAKMNNQYHAMLIDPIAE